jgi:hypothetical protein
MKGGVNNAAASVSPSPMGMYGLNQTMPIKKEEFNAFANKPDPI